MDLMSQFSPVADSADDEKIIGLLAAMDDINYFRSRDDFAQKLKLKTTDLDKLVRKHKQVNEQEKAGEDGIFSVVTPWPEYVNGSVLLHEITETIQRYAVLSLDQARACALWVAFSWFIDGANVAPILNISSPQMRCGKSKLLGLVGEFVARPLMASNISPAALFRAVERWKPTLLIDEADTFVGSSDELRGIVNAGHYRNTAYVIRTVGDDHEPKQFYTWCAKVMAGIGNLPDTIKDRSIVIELRRKLPHEKVEKLRHRDSSVLEPYRQKLCRWTLDELERFSALQPQAVEGINDRAADNWEPLLAVAELAGEDWPAHARKSAIALSGVSQEAPTIEVELLTDIRDLFEQKDLPSLFTKELIEALCSDDEKPWATWNKGRPMTASQLSKKLSPFKVKPEDVRRGSLVKKGYKLSKLQDAFERYLVQPAVSGATALHPRNGGASGAFATRYMTDGVAAEKQLQPRNDGACSVVAAGKSDAVGFWEEGCV